MPRLLLYSVTLTALITASVHGKEFVVAQQDRAATDRNPGTPRKPLKTIGAAVSKVGAGDRVLIHSGEYRETVIIKASGTAESPITIEAAAGETVVLKGSDLVTGWTVDHGAIWKAQLPKLLSRSGESSEPAFWGANEIHRVFIRDGVLLDAVHLRKVTEKKQVQPGTFFHDAASSTLYVWLPDSGDPGTCKVEAAVRALWLNALGSHVVVRGLQMRHASTMAIDNWPACNLYGEGSRLENCAMTWGDFAGVSISGKKHALVNCVIACNGDVGIGATGEGHLIDGCRVLYNNIDRYDPSWHCGGAKLIPNLTRSRITGNEFAHNIGPGLWLDDSCNENRIERNYCHDNEGPGIMLEVSSGNLVMNNVCTGNRNSPAAEFLSLNPDSKKPGEKPFRPTMLYDQRRSTLIYQGGLGVGILVWSAPASRVYNNTCYLNEGGGISVEGELRKSNNAPMATRDIRLRNNILVYNKGPQLILRKNGTDAATSGNSSDYNLFLAVGSMLGRNGWRAEAGFSLADWQRASGQDEHSREGDPYFAMPGMGDFRLLNASVAEGAGELLAEVKEDYFGQTRPKGNPSMGATEKAAGDYPRPPFR